jgi:hypothetical protein
MGVVLFHHRGAEFTESGIFLYQEFLLCALRVSAVKISFFSA